MVCAMTSVIMLTRSKQRVCRLRSGLRQVREMQLKHLLRKAAAQTFEALTIATGKLLVACSAQQLANHLANAGYQRHGGLCGLAGSPRQVRPHPLLRGYSGLDLMAPGRHCREDRDEK